MSYGCFNRAAFRNAQYLFGVEAVTGYVIGCVVPHRMTTECQYTLYDRYDDKGCIGCKHSKAAKQLAITEADLEQAAD